MPSRIMTDLRARVVCIGSAALDMLLDVDRMPPEDGRIAALDGLLAGGGPAATAAVALARLGVPAALVSVVGEDPAADLIVAGLAHDGVDVRLVRRVPGGRSALSAGLIRAAPAGTRSLVALGAQGTPLTLDDAALRACQAADWVHVDHAGWPLVTTLRSAGITTPVSVDGGNPLHTGDLSAADLYVPGATELRRSTACADLSTAMSKAIDRGARCVIVTEGAAGSSYLGPLDPDEPGANARLRGRDAATGDRRTAHVDSPTVEVRSTLGAGDVYHGALLAGLLGGRSITGAMAYASTAAALSCRGLDGRSAIPTDGEVRAHLTDHEPRRNGG